MSTHSESEIDPSMFASLQGAAGEGAAILRVNPADASETIVAAIDQFVFAWQSGQRPSEKVIEAESAPFAMGSLWGEQIVRDFGWEWKMITFHEHGNSTAPGVVSPDRGLAIYPIHFLIGCLRDPSVDATIMLSYNMLKAGTIGQVEPGSYMNLMDGVHRIVPRIPEPPKKSWWKKLTG
jgi:hypothetical protein